MFAVVGSERDAVRAYDLYASKIPQSRAKEFEHEASSPLPPLSMLAIK